MSLGLAALAAVGLAAGDLVGDWAYVAPLRDDRVRPVRRAATRARLQWLSRDHVNLVLGPGEIQGLLRCRSKA